MRIRGLVKSGASKQWGRCRAELRTHGEAAADALIIPFRPAGDNPPERSSRVIRPQMSRTPTPGIAQGERAKSLHPLITIARTVRLASAMSRHFRKQPWIPFRNTNRRLECPMTCGEFAGRSDHHHERAPIVSGRDSRSALDSVSQYGQTSWIPNDLRRICQPFDRLGERSGSVSPSYPSRGASIRHHGIPKPGSLRRTRISRRANRPRPRFAKQT